MKKYLQYIPLFLFAFFMLGYTLFNAISPSKEFSETENRVLAQFPSFTVSSLVSNEYSTKVESYITDQFANRNQWISAKSKIELLMAKSENNNIVYGDDDYMFEKMLSIDKKHMELNLGYLKTFPYRVPNSKVYFTVVPSAKVVLEDKLPYGLPLADEASAIRTAYAETEAAGMEIVDVLPTLLEHKDEYIYYRTDHHWTTTGAYYGYEAFAKAIGLTPAPLEAMTSGTIADFYGTYYNKSKNSNALADVIHYYDLPVETVVIGDKTYDSMYNIEQFASHDKYAGFLYSNNAITVIHREEKETPENPSRIMLFKDSYGNSFAPFLVNHFDEVVVVDLRYVTNIDELLRDYPSDIIYVMYSFQNFTEDANIVKLADITALANEKEN